MSERDTYRVRIWYGHYRQDAYPHEPDEVIKVEGNTVHVWQDDPYYHSPSLGLDVHPEDCPARLNVYTSDSVRSPPDTGAHYVEEGYWDGPMERGLEYPADHDRPPFGCELWDRVMFFVQPMEGDDE